MATRTRAQAKFRWNGRGFDPRPLMDKQSPQPCYVSDLGALFSGDCIGRLAFHQVRND